MSASKSLKARKSSCKRHRSRRFSRRARSSRCKACSLASGAASRNSSQNACHLIHANRHAAPPALIAGRIASKPTFPLDHSMNRYPLWKYVVMVMALAIGLIYTLPNFFGEAPAVQVLSGKATVKLDSSTLSQIEAALAANQITASDVTFDNSSTNANIRVRLSDTDTQLRVKDLLSKTLNSDPTDPNFVVALNLQSASPRWLTALHALPMYLGLDLRGGVHFLLQVDMAGALNKKLDSDASDARTLLRDNNIRDGGVNRVNQTVAINFADKDTADAASKQLSRSISELQWATQT